METLRRNRIDLMTPSELAIYKAIHEVEHLGADVKLTEAVILLSKAKDILADYVDKVEVKKDTYSYIKSLDSEYCTIYKNNLQFGVVGSEREAKYTCYALENFDDLTFGHSATNIVLYLDGRKIGELSVNQMLAERITMQMSKVFKTEPKVKSSAIDIGWEYD